jgi:phage shock protein PspC (stress-responsive transcriptional regulator)
MNHDDTTEQSFTPDPEQTAEPEPAPQPAPQPEPEPPPRFSLDPEHRIVAGVAAGLARAFAVDIVIVRIAFVVATFLHGVGALLYLAAWSALPALDRRRGSGQLAWRTVRFGIGAALTAVAAFAVLAAFDLPSSNILLPALLIGIGVALWHRSSSGWSPLPPWPQGSPPAATAQTPPDSPAAHWPWPSPRPSSYLGRLVTGVALLAVGVVLVLDRARLVHLTVSSAISVALVVVGIGLMVGTVFGRARWLALPAVVLTVLAVEFGTFEAMGLHPTGPVGYRYAAARTVADVQPAYGGGSGTVELDLADVGLGTAARSVSLDTTVGEVNVWVPVNAALVVDAETAAGWIDLPSSQVPFGIDRRAIVTETGTRGELRLRLRTGAGPIRVIRGHPIWPLPPGVTPAPLPPPPPGPHTGGA